MSKQRDRVLAALDFRPPDMVPLEYHCSTAGLFDHGEKLKELWRRYPGDFGDMEPVPIPCPDASCFDAEGRYVNRYTDAWGTLWEGTIFGILGHPIERPLDDWSRLDSYAPPAVPPASGPDFEADKQRAADHMQRYYLKSGWISVLETMRAVRRFEDVMMDLLDDSPEINRLADLITEQQLGEIEYLLARGADMITIGDDFGTQEALMLSKSTFRRFFKPRYERLIDPIKAAGKAVLFHSCGQVGDLLEDFAELGVDAIWPQVALWDAREFARRCRDLHLAVAIHPDRAHLMTYGAPQQVRENVHHLADAFDVQNGGSWFYVEIDNGMPFANVEALIETVGEMRQGGE